MPYTPIEDYALIGDMRTAALVSKAGSIDWLCLPHFDSPSVFAAILDEERGGSFRIRPERDDATSRQQYWPDSNILVTRFLTADGAAELVDFMPVGEGVDAEGRQQVIRRLTCMRGRVRFRIECEPAFDYARAEHTAHRVEGGAVFVSDGTCLALSTEVPLSVKDGGAYAVVELQEGEGVQVALRSGEPETACRPLCSMETTEAAFEATVRYWRRWLGRCRYQGRWRETVHRSALALKLLTFEPTGAIVAAPTTSLPEGIGGSRNWDYRFCWVRDSAFTVYALLRLGFTQEAEDFVGFLQEVCKEPGASGPLQVMYGIDGRKELVEEELDHLAGYRGSRPVRIGNGAYDQLQLDIYGELMDSVYLANKYASPISYDAWSTLRGFMEWLLERWDRPDHGIWEVRGGMHDFVYSRLMSWVAFDRAIRLADKRSLPADVERWRKTRDAIHEQIMERGWNPERRAFVQRYGAETLDASNLMMPLTFFVAPTDPRMLSTLDALLEPRARGGLTSNHLVYRYNLQESADGLEGEEGTFNICTFWLVEALTRAGRFDSARLEQARLIFERMLGFANHVGLYAEEIGRHGEALGNFPQGFTHIALISAAFNLDRALNEAPNGR